MYIYKYICVFGLNTTSRYNIQKANHHHPCRTSSGLKSLIYVQSPRPYTPDWTCRLGTCSLIAFSPCVITHAWRYICAPDPWKAWNNDPQMIYTWNISLNVLGVCFFLFFWSPPKPWKSREKPWKAVNFMAFFMGWPHHGRPQRFWEELVKKGCTRIFLHEFHGLKLLFWIPMMNFTGLDCCCGYHWWIAWP